MLRPAVLELAAGYLSSINIAQLARPRLQHLQRLRDTYQTAEELVTTRLPAIRAAAERIAEELRRFPASSDSVRWS